MAIGAHRTCVALLEAQLEVHVRTVNDSVMVLWRVGRAIGDQRFFGSVFFWEEVESFFGAEFLCASRKMRVFFWDFFWMVGTIYRLYMFGRRNLTHLDLRSPKAL